MLGERVESEKKIVRDPELSVAHDRAQVLNWAVMQPRLAVRDLPRGTAAVHIRTRHGRAGELRESLWANATSIHRAAHSDCAVRSSSGGSPVNMKLNAWSAAK